ncbi:branched-chain amino acid aminotransferase [Corynebacterium lujinxingii]|uniref:branched-chain-amino-acid transaminase n=1 Tax=Corynebacterium lujinxingii TaxID=2763010 RepID=A0A7H0JX97_9CORY|nr:branched-chain amino acid aminotransferase [Corynebacterium lujinxingii]MBC3177908.1 branched-chain amino acid aminotransferase [Corynebacterium lujinxingii]NNO09849.1 branched-chain amino acid aminotransferase [Corynebacterium lujinxingii]QNP89663.1 branched-chain amino acid aminotransferase [Corynebacterium lujinxingii]
MANLEFAITPSENPASDAEREQILKDPAFGQEFTDHMVSIEWNEEDGWHNPQVRAYEPISLDPASNVFHYGQAIFEGLKAYRHADGRITAFRPEQNAKRLNNSAKRMAMPELPEELFLEAVRQIVAIDEKWVPEAGGEASLYLRPFMIGTEKTLGVKPSSNFSFYIIASPAGAYFSGGVKPVSVWISEDYVRAAPGGTGDAKFAGNYAASLIAQQEAAAKGCDQVVFLDACEREYIEEMGGMNLMFVEGSGETAKIITPELTGSLLPGITRKSLLQVVKDLGYEVEERKITVDEWRTGAEDGTISETMACGTAAVITPVGRVLSKHGEFTINGGEAGEITMAMRERLRGIQTGDVEDTHGWNTTLIEA